MMECRKSTYPPPHVLVGCEHIGSKQQMLGNPPVQIEKTQLEKKKEKKKKVISQMIIFLIDIDLCFI